MLIYADCSAMDTNDFLEMLLQVRNGARYSIAEPKHIKILDDRTQTCIQELKDAIS